MQACCKAHKLTCRTESEVQACALCGVVTPRLPARGEMAVRGLYIFKHDNELGNAPAHSLFKRIQPKLRQGVIVPREFEDYDVAVNREDLPQGVELEIPGCELPLAML
jgi:CRISPR-associated protein Cas7